MPINFNADEIFEMAIKSERNAVKMYGDLAKKHQSPGISEELLKMAQMEADHANIFVEMRRELPEDMRNTVFDPNDEAAKYLKAVADASIAEGSPEIAEKMTGEESLEEILKLAIELEKQAILFYLGMKDMVPERLGRGKIEEIIKEEQGHIVTLSNRLKAL
ncbi:rubrerythrin [bacterium]|nr:MAG: rubrerythrin [bacterium]